MQAQAIALFRAALGGVPTHAASAPGRVNLIGEHTDYNGGPVLPLATTHRTVAVVGPGEPGWLRLVSTRDRRVERVRWDAALPAGCAGYIVGVMRELTRRGAAPAGACVALASDVPVGAGLASSAALTVSAGRALAALAGVALPPGILVDVAHRAESDHVGVRCGIMDQTIVVRARTGHALLLECGTGRYRHVPMRGRLLLVDTGMRHELAASAYNERRSECEGALAVLKAAHPELAHLADWPGTDQRGLRRVLPPPLLARALHVVTETDRTREAERLLRRGRLRALGELMNASHDSCRRWFECSAPPLDLVVRAARRAGACGARLTGAGWGGAVLVLAGPSRGSVRRERKIADAIDRAFTRAYRRSPSITVVRAGPGARNERVS
jgi:galactokinase